MHHANGNVHFKKTTCVHFQIIIIRSSLVAQWVKDPAWSLQQLGLLLWCKFHSWVGNFHIPLVRQKKKKKKKKKTKKSLCPPPRLMRRFPGPWEPPGPLLVSAPAPPPGVISILNLALNISSQGFLFLMFCFLAKHPQHMEVPRLGVDLELQPPACTTATAIQDLNHALQPTPQLMVMPDP